MNTDPKKLTNNQQQNLNGGFQNNYHHNPV